MDYTRKNPQGIFVPEHLTSTTLRTKDYTPLAFLQQLFNRIFYTMDESPLDFIGTLGWYDPVLPKAKAYDFLENHPGSNTVHEIGPGNFNFGRVFVDTVKPNLDSIIYQCHDFSDSCFLHVQEKLRPYKEVIKFHKRPISDFPKEVGDDPLNLILVEVIDDTLSEFFAMHEGREYMLCVQPEMRNDLVFPSKADEGRTRLLDGEFSVAVQRMVGKPSIKREYTPRDIIHFIDSGQLDKLNDIHPSFLTYFEYKDKHFLHLPIEVIYRYHWKDMPDSFKVYGDNILNFYREQLKRVQDAKTAEPVAVSIPIAGLNLLWGLKERESVHIDFFDYGYDSVDKQVVSFSTHTGQITAPVNFEVMKYAAELLDFKTILEKDTDFIKRELGENTIRINYAMRAIKGGSSWPWKKMKQFMYDLFHGAVHDLCPGVNCTPDNIPAFRVRRKFYEDVFIKRGIEAGFIEPGFEVSEGSYHLAVYK